MSRLAPVGMLLITILLSPQSASAQDQGPAAQRGARYLSGRTGSMTTGEAALAGLALIKAGVGHDDPGVRAVIKTLDRRFATSAYTPELAGPGGHSIYEASVITLFYVNLDPVGYSNRIEAVAQYILTNQMTNGGWDYGHRMGGPNGDTSISQYAVLGLWEAANSGVRIPARAWDAAAQWFLSKQGSGGGWTYHPDERTPPTISMTSAGVGSLLICKQELGRPRDTPTSAGPSSLLQPVATDPDAPQDYRARSSTAEMNAGIRGGLDWIASHWTTARGEVMGESVYYGLYGIERVGALSARKQIGDVDWYAQGRQYILANQQGDGSWNDTYNEAPNTSWAVLFLTRSTAKSVKRTEVKRLGAGTLVGGRGLPEDLSTLTIAGGRVMVRPMNGAIERMLAVLEDPRSSEATEALAGLVSRYHEEGPSVLLPHKARFRKLLTDPDPGIRAVAAWALGRTGDLDVVPDLIVAVEDPEDRVVAQARDGLRLLSRKIDGYGPEPGDSAVEKRAAAQLWRSWYESIRPPEFAGAVDRP